MSGSSDTERIAPSPLPDNKSSTTSLTTPVFAVSFVFLALVLLGNSWQNWTTLKLQLDRDEHYTVDSFVAQASITVKASAHVNHLFVRTHSAELIEQQQNPTPERQQALWHSMNQAFFNLTGYMLLDSNNRILQFEGPQLGPQENPIIERAVSLITEPYGFFAMHYGESGGYYTISRFEYEGETYSFVIRRPYTKFSSVIRDGDFHGFDLALYDHSLKKVIISKGYYYQFDEAPPLSAVSDRISYKRTIPGSPWELLALEKPGYLNQQLGKAFLPPLIILSVFVLICIATSYVLRTLHQRQNQREAAQRQIEQRAEKSLMSIDEAVITTDQHKHITYVNPKASFIFGRLGHHQVIGSLLPSVWPAEDALWARDLNVGELELLQEEQRELHLHIQNDDYILEQSYNLLYESGEISGVVWVLRDVTDAVRNRRALEESRRRYKAIFEEAAIAHCVLLIPDDNILSQEYIRIINANDAAVNLFGAQDQPHLIHAFPQLIGHQQDMLRSQIQLALNSGSNSTEFELNITRFTGEEQILWVNVSLRAGSSDNALITFIDITERKKATTELSEREQFWAKIMDDIPDLVYVVSLNEKMHQNIEYYNRSIKNLLGYKETSNTRSDRWDIDIHPDDQIHLRESLREIRTLNPGETIIQQGRALHQDGSWRVFRFTNTPFLFDESGLVCRYISTARDVTEEVQAQEKLIDNERRYRLLAENVNDIIWALNTEKEFTFISSSVFRMLGFHAEDIYQVQSTIFLQPKI